MLRSPQCTPMSGRSWFPRARLSGLIFCGALTCLSVTLGFDPLVCLAQEGPIIRAVEFEGLRRVDAAAIRIVLANRVGKPYRASAVAGDIKAIYGMGYFSDVRLYKEPADDGVRLVYRLVEKPAVRQVVYEGNDDVGTDDIKEVVDIRPFTILSEAKIKRNVQKIVDLYNEKGFYLAEVDYEIRDLKRNNQVEVVFKMIENAKVEVRQIRFVGNRELADDLLKTGLLTQEGSLLSFLTGAGTYRKDAFQVDILRITSHYFNNGYINVKVDTPDIEISPDRKYIYITIRIEEGLQYSIGKLGFRGDTLDSGKSLEDYITVEEGEIFNREKLGRDLLTLKTRFEDEGYAYANITPVTKIDSEKRTVGLIFEVDKGDKVYYERINIVGNTKTRDKVVRRELRIYEGELTSRSRREYSQQRVNALGYFETVDIKTRRGSNDSLQVVDVVIKEKATGTFQIGAGFSSAENFIATAQISQQNFLGHGQTVSLSAQISSLRQLFQLQFSDPYFLDSNWTFSLNGFNTQTQFRSFLRASTGGSVTFGYPLTDFIRMFLTYSIEFVRSEPDAGLFDQPALASLNNRGRISSLRATTTYDSRDNRLFPTRGMFHSAVCGAVLPGRSAPPRTGPFSDTAWNSRFLPAAVLALRRSSFRSAPAYLTSDAEAGAGSVGESSSWAAFRPCAGTCRSLSVPSGARTINDQRLAAAYDPLSQTFVFVEGGNKEFLANFEIEFPIFQQVGIKGVLFLDAGNVYAEEENFFYIGDSFREPQRDASDPNRFDNRSLPLGLFWSVGFGFRWFSPIGPLRFEWGIPLTRRPTDPDGPLFEFSIGNSF